eukprot:COSAG02_NODE_2152_length_9655_cov_6.433654_5_plen_90_part_00
MQMAAGVPQRTLAPHTFTRCCYGRVALWRAGLGMGCVGCSPPVVGGEYYRRGVRARHIVDGSMVSVRPDDRSLPPLTASGCLRLRASCS